MGNESMRMNRFELGKLAERIAADRLAEEGYTIIERNWRCPRGELDVIAEKDGFLVFVEVRSRRATGTFGLPEESVDARKQRQVRETARYYMHRSGQSERNCRFHVVTVLFGKSNEAVEVKLIPDAF